VINNALSTDLSLIRPLNTEVILVAITFGPGPTMDLTNPLLMVG